MACLGFVQSPLHCHCCSRDVITGKYLYVFLLSVPDTSPYVHECDELASAYIFLWKASKIKGSTSDFFEIFTPDLQNWSIVSATCTILTNLLSTGLIAGRIW